jgi:hypothetical protein
MSVAKAAHPTSRGFSLFHGANFQAAECGQDFLAVKSQCAMSDFCEGNFSLPHQFIDDFRAAAPDVFCNFRFRDEAGW